MNEYEDRFAHNPKSVGDPVEEKYRPGRVSLIDGHVADTSLTHLRYKSP
jgi:hypothetical protein